MEEEQFEDLKSSLDTIETNTSWTWYVNDEVEKVNKRLENIEELLEENNNLLRQLIIAITK